MSEMIMKEKMAVIFHGIIGGMGGRNGIGLPISISDCAKTIKCNILSAYDCDIFMHSWSTSHEDEIKMLYNPISAIFEPQEYFNFSEKQISGEEKIGQAFRTVSRYVSLERALKLKQKYEQENNFKYKWVILLRYDLVFFNKLDLSILDNNSIYVCKEPHWGDVKSFNMVHDIVFLSNSRLIDMYGTLANDFRNKKYDASSAHHCAHQKIREILNDNLCWVKYGFHRYIDVEIYRLIMNPEQNPIGHIYGALQTKGRLEKLLEEINKTKNE